MQDRLWGMALKLSLYCTVQPVGTKKIKNFQFYIGTYDYLAENYRCCCLPCERSEELLIVVGCYIASSAKLFHLLDRSIAVAWFNIKNINTVFLSLKRTWEYNNINTVIADKSNAEKCTWNFKTPLQLQWRWYLLFTQTAGNSYQNIIFAERKR